MLHTEEDTRIQDRPFWTLSIPAVVGALETDPEKGISEEEARERLRVFGPNMIEKPSQTSAFFILLGQFKSPLILILLGAGFATLFIAHYRDALFIFAAVIANALLGFYQEHKAEEALGELAAYLKQRSRVIRGGIEHEIDAADLVPGDVVVLAQGDRIPADARLTAVNDLQTDEAILTGESLPVSKSVEPVSPEAGLGDQRSMAFAGTLVTQGLGMGLVCRTDFFTELGKIAALVAESRKGKTPLQQAIRRFSIRAGVVLGILTLIIFAAGIAAGYSRVDMFLTSVAIAVSAVPEGLPVALTVILAIGVQRMARRKGVIRKLVAAEALGSATVILTDKTGTLTMAKMELSRIVSLQGSEETELLEHAILNTNVFVENPNDPPSAWRMNGRLLEVALVRAAGLRGMAVGEIKKKGAVTHHLPFNAVNKFSASIARDHARDVLLVLGAPDILLRGSMTSPEKREEVLKTIETLAESGELVLGLAMKQVKPGFVLAKNPDLIDLEFRGLITFRDPIRPGVPEAIRKVESAGIRTVIMTGDHRGTAEAIAREAGMRIEKDDVLDASALRELSDPELRKRLRSVRLISRISPLDKMRIVKLMQEAGEVVAMTGDGVNDAPSIRQADIGIAMGSGTEVARDVADLVLLDDNFETIAAAVEEGRQIMHNIRKVIVYLLSSVADELFLIGGALMTGVPLPLNALQILYVNFFSDSFPAIAFAFEKNQALSIRSRLAKTGLFDPLMKFLILFIGLSTSALLFLLYWFLLRAGFPQNIVRTFIFAAFGSYTLFLTFSARDLEKSILEYSPFSNRYLIAGVMIGIMLMGAALYLPFLQSILGTVSLPLYWLLAVVLIGLLNLTVVELGKKIFRGRIP